jgi:hypothetical protein
MARAPGGDFRVLDATAGPNRAQLKGPADRSARAFGIHPHLHTDRPLGRVDAGGQGLGWLMGLEPTTTRITIWDSTN